ncbi:DUF4011 domain-containing protein [Nocardioides dongxiaopingii]|uniref:DUF4011 domain-containing protein n=1 Tax=Nocardioides sp. S-1144 TaxID=2582905 RepID=UPI00110D3962|nr:DUF4011 domain-containing protein [Nocardioides sp. S-1144]
MSVTRSSPGAVSPAKFVAELRSMARRAKEAHDERGMNPLFLCVGLLRWSHKAGAMAKAPLLLVPVKLTQRRTKHEFGLTLDTASQTTPNAALIEWLRREHGLTIPELAEPASDRAGLDVDGILADVRRAVADRGLPFDVTSEARFALLDLSSFRMWQDLHRHANQSCGGRACDTWSRRRPSRSTIPPRPPSPRPSTRRSTGSRRQSRPTTPRNRGRVGARGAYYCAPGPARHRQVPDDHLDGGRMPPRWHARALRRREGDRPLRRATAARCDRPRAVHPQPAP